MNVAQPGQVRLLKGQTRLPVVETHLPVGEPIQLVDVTRRLEVQLLDQRNQTLRVCRRVADEVVMVRENRPGLELPAERLRLREELRLEKVQAVGPAEIMDLLVGAGRDDVGALLAESVQWGVRPVAVGGRTDLRRQVRRGRRAPAG